MLPDGLGAELDEDRWIIPPVFPLMAKVGQIDWQEMYNIFNMGIGMVLTVDQEHASEVVEHFRQSGESAFEIGVVTENQGVTIGAGR